MNELTIKEFASHFDMTPSGVKYWIKQGKVKSRLTLVKGRQTRLIPIDEVERLQEEQRCVITSFDQGTNAPDRPDEADQTERTDLVTTRLISLINLMEQSVLSDRKLNTIEQKIEALANTVHTGRNGDHWQPWRETVKLLGDRVLKVTRKLLKVAV